MSNFLLFKSFDRKLYTQFYFDEQSNGFVVIHKKHGLNEVEGNKTIALLLANLGYGVVLLPNIQNILTSDASIDDEIWEFKTISHTGNLSNRVHKVISKGKHQSSKVLIYIAQSYKMYEITNGISNAIRVDKDELIQEIAILFENKQLIFVRREEVIDKTFIGKFLVPK
jgi:hypothetical protein